ncbi:MAG: hypothetical protein OXE17_13625 [Chloroflexi bacterium]|nr:hypothetical protein [Chloroflexota bacterium]
MLVGVLIGLAIMVGCFLIPIAHFVLAPAGPFIAGYWGIQYAPNPGRHYAMHGLIFGSLLGLFMGIVLSGMAFLLTALFDDSRVAVLAWLGTGVFTLYTGSMGTMGAMFYTLRDQQRAQQAAEQQSEPGG